MSQPSPSLTSPVQEKTFSSYNEEQSRAYAQIRRNYHPNVYKAVINQHTSNGGQFDTLLDIGCGPGTATHSLAPYFAHVIGLDPSKGMITTARALGSLTSTAEPVRFEVASAEDLGQNLSPPVQDASVDLITAANAAHWFDMSRFWQSAARVLKPGGTVILWTSGDITAHPSMPNAEAIQAAIEKHHEDHLKPYYEPGNLLTRNGYQDLPLPWTLAEPVSEFNKRDFFRKDWDISEDFFVGPQEADLDMFEKASATASAEVRWRQAHPNDVGTERDGLKILRTEIERLLHDAGVEKGKETLKELCMGYYLFS